MGCLFAAHLKRAGNDVTLLDYRRERASLINDNGIQVEGVTGEFGVQVPTVTGQVPGIPDLVLICVKANHTRRAAEELRALIGRETRILTLQNGLGNLDVLLGVFGGDRVMGGVTAEGATLLGPGHVRHAGQGQTVIGPEGLPGDPLPKIVHTFKAAGFDTRSADNVNELIWGKLVVNIGINALTAITRLKNGRLPDIEGTRTVMEEAVLEAVAVANAKGVNLPYPDPLERVIGVCRATAANIASMLQDVLKQKVTEVEFINGAIVREGEILGIPTPVNRTLSCLVQAIQKTFNERLNN